MITETPEGTITVQQAAEVLGVGVRQVQRLMKSGVIADAGSLPVPGRKGAHASLVSAADVAKAAIRRPKPGRPKKMSQDT